MLNCQAFDALPHVCNFDAVFTRKRLLRNSIHKRVKEKKNLDKDLDKQWQNIKGLLSSINLLMFKKITKRNVERKVFQFIKTHEKKLKALTKNSSVPFTDNDTVLNISSNKLGDKELDILKFGLPFTIKPRQIRKSQIFIRFDILLLLLSLLLLLLF